MQSILVRAACCMHAVLQTLVALVQSAQLGHCRSCSHVLERYQAIRCTFIIYRQRGRQLQLSFAQHVCGLLPMRLCPPVTRSQLWCHCFAVSAGPATSLPANVATLNSKRAHCHSLLSSKKRSRASADPSGHTAMTTWERVP
jgi:hypothetical protein